MKSSRREALLLSAPSEHSSFAPFRVRSFRFQWPADLTMSWAYEMENIVLGWYILVETQSVALLTLFASMQYFGTLLSPMFGVMGNRLGTKRLLCGMRAVYTVLSLAMLTLVLAGQLSPLYVFIASALLGMVRPSDLVMRYALIGETMPANTLMVTSSVSRTTQDSARVMGALTGAGLVAAFGMGAVYVAIACLYGVSLLLTTRVADVRRAPAVAGQAGEMAAGRASAWMDLREGVAYTLQTPAILAAMWLAFLINLTAFPVTHGLLPYAARDIFHAGQTGLGYLAASFAAGALAGSILLSRLGHAVPPARCMVVFCAAWHAMLAVFAQMPTLLTGCAALVLVGCAQSLGTVSMSAMLLRAASGPLRSRVMGLRMLMIYGLPAGLLAAGWVISHFGYTAMVNLYAVTGIVGTIYIALRWRDQLWRADAPANLR